MRTPLAIARADALGQPRPTRSLAALLLFTLATVIAPQPATASEFPRCLGVAAAGASDKCPPVLYDVFARGLDNSLVHKQFREGTGWTGWVSLGGVLGGDPGAASWSGGAIDIFARGVDSSLVHKQFRETTGWTGWIGHGGSLAGDPSVSEWGPGSLDVFARASNGTVVDKQFREASGWTWASLGTAPAGDPIAVSWGSGAIDLFARGTDGALWQRQYRAATGWTGWMSRGGIIAGDPAVVTWGPGAIDVFARRASDNALVSMQYRDATGWSGWALRSSTPLGSDPAAVSPYRGGIDVFATDTAGQVMSMQYRDAHGWTGWASLGGIIRGTPTVTTWKYRYTSWRYGGTDRIINTTDEAQALKAAVEGAAPTERDELLADLSPGEAAFFIQTAYPTSWQYGGANRAVDDLGEIDAVTSYLASVSAVAAETAWAGLTPADRARVMEAAGQGIASPDFTDESQPPSEDLISVTVALAQQVNAYQSRPIVRVDAECLSNPDTCTGQSVACAELSIAIYGSSGPCNRLGRPETPDWWIERVNKNIGGQEYSQPSSALASTLGTRPADDTGDRRGWAAHHIIAAWHRSAVWTRIMATKCGIHPSSLHNGIYLRGPRRYEGTPGFSLLSHPLNLVAKHKAPWVHDEDYWIAVNAHMLLARRDDGSCDESKARTNLQKVQSQLRAGFVPPIPAIQN